MSRKVPYPLYYHYPADTTYDVKGVFDGKFWAKNNEEHSFNWNFVRQSEDFSWVFSTQYPGTPRWWLPISLGVLYMGIAFIRGDAFQDDWEDFENLDYMDAGLLGSFILDGYRFSWAGEEYQGEYFPNYFGIGQDSGIHFPHSEVACHTHNYVDYMSFFMVCYLTLLCVSLFCFDWPVYLSGILQLRPRRRFDYELYIESSKRLDLGRDCGAILK